MIEKDLDQAYARRNNLPEAANESVEKDVILNKHLK